MHKNRIIRSIANQIVDGPVALYPPDTKYEWYEKDLFIRIGILEEINGLKTITGHESVSIWSDSTMNKEIDYFPPIIRYTRWDVKEDTGIVNDASSNVWPSVAVELGNINNPGVLDDELYSFQEMVSQLPYIPSGLSFQRDIPDADTDDRFSEYRLFCRNGLQGVEFSGVHLLNDNFSDRVFRFFNLVKAQMKPFDKAGWKEKFRTDFEYFTENDFYYWDYSKPGYPVKMGKT